MLVVDPWPLLVEEAGERAQSKFALAAADPQRTIRVDPYARTFKIIVARGVGGREDGGLDIMRAQGPHQPGQIDLRAAPSDRWIGPDRLDHLQGRFNPTERRTARKRRISQLAD